MQVTTFDEMVSFSSLHAASMRAVKGKRAKNGASQFLAGLETKIFQLKDKLSTQTWQPGKHVDFIVKDPKKRIVSAAPFADRVVHHALHAAIAPSFENSFIHDSYANRVGYGTHKALKRYEYYRDRYRFVLRADIWKYFPCIDHEILQADIRKKIKCPKMVWLCNKIIDNVQASSLQTEYCNIFFPGDDLFSNIRPRGLPLGNLTSQFFANVYLNSFDHYCKEVLKAPYLRYVDDFALFSNDRNQLQEWLYSIQKYLEKRRLILNSQKTQCLPTNQLVAFLGFETAPNIRRLLPQNVTRFKQRLNHFRYLYKKGEVEASVVRQSIFAWIAHAQHAQTTSLRHHLFAGGWFDPFWENDQPVKIHLP